MLLLWHHKFIRPNVTVVVLAMLLLVSVGVAHAAPTFNSGFVEVDTLRRTNGISDKELPEMILEVINVALSFVGILALAAVVYGGFQYITSLGNEKNAEHAKKVILYAVIGLVIVGVSAIVVNFVINTFMSS